MTTNDLFWLAGLLEGEGSFMHGPPSSPNSPRIAIQMTDEDIIKKVSTFFGVKYHRVKSPKSSAYKPIFVCTVVGKRAINLMLSLKPLMGSRRASKIDGILSSPNTSYRTLTKEAKEALLQDYFSNTLSRKELAAKYNISYSWCCRIIKRVPSDLNRNLQEPQSCALPLS